MTPHFSLAELTFSELAVRRGFDNTPDAAQQRNLRLLCEEVLEPARRALGPIRISSAYRSPKVNMAVGGSPSSQHMAGQAADGITLHASLKEYLVWLHANAPYCQLIWEFGQWVHVSYDEMNHSRILLVAHRPPGRGTVYQAVDGPAEAFRIV